MLSLYGLESLIFLLASLSRRTSLSVHILNLPDRDIPDDVVMEAQLPFAFRPDIEKIIVSLGRPSRFPRREDIIGATQSIEATEQGLFEAKHHGRFSLGATSLNRSGIERRRKRHFFC
jgi:hypothetical protein